MNLCPVVSISMPGRKPPTQPHPGHPLDLNWGMLLGVMLLAQAAAMAMPLQLLVKGSQLFDSNDKPVRLRGVNCAGLEWSNDADGRMLQTVATAIAWGANIVRLPLAQDRWFGKAPEQKDEGAAYRALVKQIVDLCAQRDIHILLDLHWSDAGQWGVSIAQHNMPDENSLAFWQDLAKVYANHPAVLFDLYNEPHDVSWDIWLKGGIVIEHDWHSGRALTYEAIGMQEILDSIRKVGAQNVVVAGGLDWAFNLSGILEGHGLSDPQGHGVIYACHFYPVIKNTTVEEWAAQMEKAKELCIIVSEFGAQNRRRNFGGPGENNPVRGEVGEAWVRHVLQVMDQRHLNWIAWDLHPNAGPCLISDWEYTPTPEFGVWVKKSLEGTLPPFVPAPAPLPLAAAK